MKKITLSLCLFSLCFVMNTQLKAQQKVSITFSNTSQYTITSMQAHFCNSDTWGSNLLLQSTDHEGYLFPGEKMTVNFFGAGCYDLKLIDEDGIACEVYDIQINSSDNKRVVEIPDLTECHD